MPDLLAVRNAVRIYPLIQRFTALWRKQSTNQGLERLETRSLAPSTFPDRLTRITRLSIFLGTYRVPSDLFIGYLRFSNLWVYFTWFSASRPLRVFGTYGGVCILPCVSGLTSVGSGRLNPKMCAYENICKINKNKYAGNIG